MTDKAPEVDGLVLDGVWITDTREVRLSGIEGAPWLTTRSGNDPIDPFSVALTYNIAKPADNAASPVRDGDGRHVLRRDVRRNPSKGSDVGRGSAPPRRCGLDRWGGF